MNYRHEWKHEICFGDVLALRSRLHAIASVDEHAENGVYKIRSLYFDNLDDRALREKIDGVNIREKFRIRYYNADTSLIRLEKKSKINGLCAKQSTSISAKTAQEIASGNASFAQNESVPLIRELSYKMKSEGLRPKTIVDYTREAFVFVPGNVRITLDYDLRTGLHCTDFLNPECITIPAGRAPILLEVKWDAYLPDVIRDAIQLPDCRVTAFSKYAACRIYG